MAIIVSGDWWRLEDDGTLYIYCAGDMPIGEDADSPWIDYYEYIRSVVIQDSVTNIAWGAFSGFESLSSVTIGNGVTSIGRQAFAFCVTLHDIIIPANVTSIGEEAFAYCAALESVSIPYRITSIEQYTFDSCSGLTSVIIPNGVTSIGDAAFSNCDNLSDVYYGGTELQWDDIYVGGYNSALWNAEIHYNYSPSVTIYTVTFDANGGTGTMSAQTFDAGTAQALTPNAFTRTGYTFGGWNTAADGSGTDYADGASYTASADVTLYAQWIQIVLTSIAVTNPPTKTAYMAGETFSRTGMVVTASYSDGTTATVSSYSVSPSEALTISNTSVTISYTEGGITKTATVAITVTESEPIPGTVVLSGIAITTPPAKTTYTAGEIFSTAGMVVTAAYSDGTTATVTNYSVFPSGALTASDTIITVSYTEDGVTKAATVAITVTGETPEPTPAVIGRITYTGQSKPIRRLCEAVNALYARTPRLFIDGDAYISMDYGGDGE